VLLFVLCPSCIVSVYSTRCCCLVGMSNTRSPNVLPNSVCTLGTRCAGERLKCVLQIQESPSYKGVKYNGYKELINGLYKEGGVMGIFRGSGIT